MDTGTDGRGAPHSWHDLWNLWVIFSGFSSLDLPPLARVCAALWWKPTCRTVPSPRWCADRAGGRAGGLASLTARGGPTPGSELSQKAFSSQRKHFLQHQVMAVNSVL